MTDKLDAQAIALSTGITWSLGVLTLGLGANLLPSWNVAVDFLANFYIGYSTTITGALTGALTGFLDVAVGLYVLVSLYNYFHENPVF